MISSQASLVLSKDLMETLIDERFFSKPRLLSDPELNFVMRMIVGCFSSDPFDSFEGQCRFLQKGKSSFER